MDFEYLKGVSTLVLSAEKCRGCGLCLSVCPRGVLKMDGSVIAIEKPDHCIECGACMINCPFGALTVNAGVGCAVGILNGILKKDKPCC